MAVAVVEKGKSTIAKAVPDTVFVECSDTAPLCDFKSLRVWRKHAGLLLLKAGFDTLSAS